MTHMTLINFKCPAIGHQNKQKYPYGTILNRSHLKSILTEFDVCRYLTKYQSTDKVYVSSYLKSQISFSCFNGFGLTDFEWIRGNIVTFTEIKISLKLIILDTDDFKN